MATPGPISWEQLPTGVQRQQCTRAIVHSGAVILENPPVQRWHAQSLPLGSGHALHSQQINTITLRGAPPYGITWTLQLGTTSNWCAETAMHNCQRAVRSSYLRKRNCSSGSMKSSLLTCTIGMLFTEAAEISPAHHGRVNSILVSSATRVWDNARTISKRGPSCCNWSESRKTGSSLRSSLKESCQTPSTLFVVAEEVSKLVCCVSREPRVANHPGDYHKDGKNTIRRDS